MSQALIYKSIILNIVLLAAIITSPLVADYTNVYWTKYGNNPVLIQQRSNGSSQTLKFVAFKDGMLVAELEGGVGEISLPVSESMVRTLRLDNSKMPEIERMIRRGSFTPALNLLRPKAYPLIKFHQVPDSFTQLHAPIRSLINTLIKAKEYKEAHDLLNRVRLDKVGIKYSQSAIALMRAYLREGDYDKVAKMTEIIPVEGQYAVNIRPIVDAANALRAAGKYEAVIPLYRQIKTVVSDDVKKNVHMWLAYCLVLADRVDEATPMIEALEEPKPNERLFSL